MLTKRTLSKSQKLDRTELLNIANKMYDGSVHYRWPLPNIVVLSRTPYKLNTAISLRFYRASVFIHESRIYSAIIYISLQYYLCVRTCP